MNTLRYQNECLARKKITVSYKIYVLIVAVLWNLFVPKNVGGIVCMNTRAKIDRSIRPLQTPFYLCVKNSYDPWMCPRQQNISNELKREKTYSYGVFWALFEAFLTWTSNMIFDVSNYNVVICI